MNLTQEEYERVQQRVRYRKLARDYVELFEFDLNSTNDSTKEAFWREIISHSPFARLLDPPKEEKPAVEPMTDAEAKDFDRFILRLAPHKGKQIKDVPKSELEKMADRPDWFRRALRNYLASDRVKNEIEQEEATA
jgi:hypothetical protein